jgi:hypothetical protein
LDRKSVAKVVQARAMTSGNIPQSDLTGYLVKSSTDISTV